MGRTATSFREADLKRAIAAANKAGMRHYRVDIQPNGTISVIVGSEAISKPGSSCDDLIG